MVATLPLACFLSMITPPGVQFENSLLQIAPVDKAKCPYVKDKNDIEFQLYTRHNPTVYQPLKVDDDEVLFASNIDFHDTTVLYFHAFMENPNDGSAVMVREAYVLRGDTNVIMVDASRLEAGPWYFTAAENTWYIGRFAAELIDFLVSRGLDLSRTHLVGHSLGGQAAGVAGSSIKAGRVARITGLDPALPLFAKLPLEQRLDPSDAEFVDVIHTDAGIFGVAEQTGHVDFYPNGGISPQPGCELEVVLHEQMLLNKCDNNTKLGFLTFYLKPIQKQSLLITKIMKLFNYMQTMKYEGKNIKNVKKNKKYTIPDNIRSNIKRLTDQKDGKFEDLLPNVDIKTPFDKLKLHAEDKRGDVTQNKKYVPWRDVNFEFSTNMPESSTEYFKFSSNAHGMPLVDTIAHVDTKLETNKDGSLKHFEEKGFNEEQMKDDGILEIKKQLIDSTQTIKQEGNKEVNSKININDMSNTSDIKTKTTDMNGKSNESKTKLAKDFSENDKKIELSDVANINTDTNTKIENEPTKSHVRKRQKRFVNPFRQSEAAESDNFLFKMLDFLLKHRRNIIPVFSVMREVNTLVKSANGELNHVSKERNNYIGSPPPVPIPVTYSLELGNENRAVAFMKKLLGFRVNGDKLMISGTGK